MAFIQDQKRREVLKGVMQELRQAAKIEVNLPGPASAPAPAK
jgi:hypothetical protein